MTDPQRLSDSNDDEFARTLLGSARADVGSEPALRRALAAFTATVAATPVNTAQAANQTGGLTLAQWAGVGIAVTSLAVIGTLLVRPTTSEHPRPLDRSKTADQQSGMSSGTEGQRAIATPKLPSAAASQPITPDLTPTGLTEPRTQRRTHTIESRPQPTRASGRHTSVEASASASEPTLAPPQQASTLAAEVRLLEQARAAIAHRDPTQALAFLDRYAREFRTGALTPEAAVLRVEALIAQNNWPRARLEAGGFLAHNPNGAAATRIRALLTQKPNP